MMRSRSTDALNLDGRPHLVDILDCYLQQNMIYNVGHRNVKRFARAPKTDCIH